MYFTPYYLNSPTVLNSPIYDRPNLIGNPHVSHPNRNEWYNPAAYADPAQYTFGNAGRNSLLGPGSVKSILSLTKSFTITERTHLDLKWDVFNALNREIWTHPPVPVRHLLISETQARFAALLTSDGVCRLEPISLSKFPPLSTRLASVHRPRQVSFADQLVILSLDDLVLFPMLACPQ